MSSLLDEECEVEEPEPECLDEAKMAETRGLLSRLMRRSVVSSSADDEAEVAEGEKLEEGWEKRGKSSSIRRNIEVWRALGGCALKVLKARKGTSEDKTAAATFARDKLLTLGPTFVKLGQVLSTRTDVLPAEYIDVLKSLQDDVPAFGGDKAKAIVAAELGVDDVSEVFSAFGDEPIAAASLGQVHLGTLKKTGQRVAVKVQRAGLRELFATDLKNLRKLCELLDKLDPKSDGADRSYIDVFDESEKLLYLEIDYLNEARNADRFRADFAGDEGTQVRVPAMFYEFSTPKVLTMEYIDSFKLTDMSRIEAEGLDKADLAKRIADSCLPGRDTFNFKQKGRLPRSFPTRFARVSDERSLTREGFFLERARRSDADSRRVSRPGSSTRSSTPRTSTATPTRGTSASTRRGTSSTTTLA